MAIRHWLSTCMLAGIGLPGCMTYLTWQGDQKVVVERVATGRGEHLRLARIGEVTFLLLDVELDGDGVEGWKMLEEGGRTLLLEPAWVDDLFVRLVPEPSSLRGIELVAVIFDDEETEPLAEMQFASDQPGAAAPDSRWDVRIRWLTNEDFDEISKGTSNSVFLTLREQGSETSVGAVAWRAAVTPLAVAFDAVTIVPQIVVIWLLWPTC